MFQVPAVKVQSAFESLTQRDLRLPPKNLPDTGEIRIIVADIDSLPFLGVGPHLVSPSSVDFDQQVREVLEADDTVAAQVEYLAVGGVTCRGGEQRIHGVIDVGEIP